MFSLASQQLDKGVLAQSIGIQFFTLLRRNLGYIDKLPRVLSLHQDHGSVYQTLDIVRVILKHSPTLHPNVNILLSDHVICELCMYLGFNLF